jgi:hypothetical protein
MILDPATPAQMEAARIVAGATMVAFLGARVFGKYAAKIRILAVGLYIAGVLSLLLFVLL